jgi:predicted nucleotidyltransferase
MVTREFAINTVKSFIRDCKSNGLTFYKVLIFGSVAKNNTHKWSDIDLLLISDQFNDNVFDNLKLYSKINIKYPLIETHPYPTNYYKDGDGFINEIVKDSIEIE